MTRMIFIPNPKPGQRDSFLRGAYHAITSLLGLDGTTTGKAVTYGDAANSGLYTLVSGQYLPAVKFDGKELRTIYYYWDDLRFPSGLLNPPGAVSDPDRDTSDGTLLFDAGSTERIVSDGQMPHTWAQGTKVRPHVHWGATTTGTGTVDWLFEYKVWPTVGSVPVAWSTLSATGIADGTTDSLVTPLGEIDMTGLKASALIVWRLSRTGGTDTYAGDAKLYSFDIHYLNSSLGTYEEY